MTDENFNMTPQRNNADIENRDAWLRRLEDYNVYFSNPFRY